MEPYDSDEECVLDFGWKDADGFEEVRTRSQKTLLKYGPRSRKNRNRQAQENQKKRPSRRKERPRIPLTSPEFDQQFEQLDKEHEKQVEQILAESSNDQEANQRLELLEEQKIALRDELDRELAEILDGIYQDDEEQFEAMRDLQELPEAQNSTNQDS